MQGPLRGLGDFPSDDDHPSTCDRRAQVRDAATAHAEVIGKRKADAS